MQSDGKVAVITSDTRRIGRSFAGSFLAGGQDGQHLLAVLGELGLTEPGDLDQRRAVGRPGLRDGHQGRVGEHAERWHLLLAGLLLAPLLEQRQGVLVVRRRAVGVPTDLALGRIVQGEVIDVSGRSGG